MNASSLNIPYSEQFRLVAKQWVDADAAATLLEDTKSAILSERMQMLIRGDPGLALNRAEATVKASNEWREWVSGMVDARKKANLLKVQLEYLRMKFNEWQSHEASKRAEMRL
jgi:hypothetical protein